MYFLYTISLRAYLLIGNRLYIKPWGRSKASITSNENPPAVIYSSSLSTERPHFLDSKNSLALSIVASLSKYPAACKTIRAEYKVCALSCSYNLSKISSDCPKIVPHTKSKTTIDKNFFTNIPLPTLLQNLL